MTGHILLYGKSFFGRFLSTNICSITIDNDMPEALFLLRSIFHLRKFAHIPFTDVVGLAPIRSSTDN